MRQMNKQIKTPESRKQAVHHLTLSFTVEDILLYWNTQKENSIENLPLFC